MFRDTNFTDACRAEEVAGPVRGCHSAIYASVQLSIGLGCSGGFCHYLSFVYACMDALHMYICPKVCVDN